MYCTIDFRHSNSKVVLPGSLCGKLFCCICLSDRHYAATPAGIHCWCGSMCNLHGPATNCKHQGAELEARQACYVEGSGQTWSSNLFSNRNKLEALREHRPPWRRQIITLILPTVKMLSLGCERLPTPLKKKKKKKTVLDHYLHHDLGMLPLLRCFFAHLLILQYPDHHQNLISSSLYYSGPVHKISSQSVHNFLSNVVHRQTDKQTDKQTN